MSQSEESLSGIPLQENEASSSFSSAPRDTGGPDLEMFMDVNIAVSVEVGRAEIKLRDLLNLSKDSVVELNKLAGESLDILANGKLIAYGEIVAINGKYGVRLVSIANKSERIKHATQS